jgi:hypothetical protein
MLVGRGGARVYKRHLAIPAKMPRGLWQSPIGVTYTRGGRMNSKQQQELEAILAYIKRAKQGITTVRDGLSSWAVTPGIRADIQWTAESIEEALWRIKDFPKDEG